ncbi:MAG TPA: DUF2065 family protein [Geothermobacteraceae bacterium]|nr:DUF2065 family protein [Geothermobacteraceae bacterium]
MKLLFTSLGLLLVLEGLPWFLSPLRLRQAMAQLARLSDSQLRVLGLLCMLSGLLLVYLARG